MPIETGASNRRECILTHFDIERQARIVQPGLSFTAIMRGRSDGRSNLIGHTSTVVSGGSLESGKGIAHEIPLVLHQVRKE